MTRQVQKRCLMRLGCRVVATALDSSCGCQFSHMAIQPMAETVVAYWREIGVELEMRSIPSAGVYAYAGGEGV